MRCGGRGPASLRPHSGRPRRGEEAAAPRPPVTGIADFVVSVGVEAGKAGAAGASGRRMTGCCASSVVREVAGGWRDRTMAAEVRRRPEDRVWPVAARLLASTATVIADIEPSRQLVRCATVAPFSSFAGDEPQNREVLTADADSGPQSGPSLAPASDHALRST